MRTFPGDLSFYPMHKGGHCGNRTAHYKIILARNFLNSGIAGSHIFKPEAGHYLIYHLDFFPYGIYKMKLRFRVKNSKRNPGEATTCTHVKNVCSGIESLHLRNGEGMYYVT